MASSSDKLYQLEELLPLLREKQAQGESLCIGPKGTSMRPLIRQGIDYVELSALPEKLKKYDLPLYQRTNGQYVLHRIVKAGETYTCVGDNQFQLEPGIKPEQMIALVTAVYRGEKRWSVDALSYRIYCRLWHHSRPLRQLYLRVKNHIKRKLSK